LSVFEGLTTQIVRDGLGGRRRIGAQLAKYVCEAARRYGVGAEAAATGAHDDDDYNGGQPAAVLKSGDGIGAGAAATAAHDASTVGL
jgi:hypothetical protein